MHGFETLKQLIDAGEAERTLVIAPRWTAIRGINRDLAQGRGVLFGLRATTPLDLLHNLAAGHVQGILISAVVAQELVGMAVTGIRSRGGLLDLLSRASGRRAAFHTIRELTLAGIGSADLRAAGGELFETFASLIDAYRALCDSKGVLDDAAWMNASLDALERAETQLPHIRHIWITGFPSIPWPFQRLIRVISRDRDLHLHLPTDEGRTGLFEDNRALLSPAAWPAAQVTTHPFPVTAGADALGAVQSALFTPAPQTVAIGEGQISFHRAPGRYDEAEAAAIRIAALLDDGTPPARIAVTVRDLSQYDQFIRDAFDRLRIPYAHRRGMPMLLAPPVRLAMRFIEAGAEPLRWDRLIGIVQSVFLNYPGSANWPDIIRSTGSFRLNAADWAGRLRRTPANDRGAFTADDIKSCADAVDSLLQDCLALHTGADPLAGLRKLCKARIDCSAPAFTNEERIAHTRQLRRFMEIIDGIERDFALMREKRIEPVTQPFDLLRDALAQESIPEPQHPGDAVQVLNFYDMGYARADHLFILGLDEQTVPRPPHQSAGILGEREVERLAEISPAATTRLRTAAARRALEEQAFVLAVGSAGLSLHCYHRCYDEDTREVTASPYFLELRRLCGEPPVRTEPGGDCRSLAQTPAEKHALRRQLLRSLFRTDIPRDPSLPAAYERMNRNADENRELRRLARVIEIERRREQALFRQMPYDRWSGVIGADELRAVIAQSFADDAWTWSQRAVQAYADSPYGFFLDYLLRLVPRDAPLEEFDPRDTGTSLHRIIKDFTGKTAYPISDVEAARAQMNESIADEFRNRFPGESYEQPGPMPKLWLHSLGRLLMQFVAVEAEERSWVPIESERRFSRVPCVLDASGRSIGLSGAFDRIDVGAPGTESLHRIVDFKSGSLYRKTPKPETVIDMLNLQLPVYILAAAALLEKDPELIGAELYSLRDCRRTGIQPGAEEWAGFFGIGDGVGTLGIRDVLRNIVNGVQSGAFPVASLNNTKLNDYVNLVGRWLELPPELADIEGEA